MNRRGSFSALPTCITVTVISVGLPDLCLTGSRNFSIRRASQCKDCLIRLRLSCPMRSNINRIVQSSKDSPPKPLRWRPIKWLTRTFDSNKSKEREREELTATNERHRSFYDFVTTITLKFHGGFTNSLSVRRHALRARLRRGFAFCILRLNCDSQP